MWNRVIFLVLFSLTALGLSFGQSKDGQSQTLRAILAELRAIHNDIRINETTQLLVAELQMQQNAVNRATENVDSTQSRLDGVHRDQKLIAVELQHNEEMLNNSNNQDERKSITEAIERAKSNGLALKVMERDLSATLAEMKHRLETAQAKLDDIENELKAAISRLQPVRKDDDNR